MESVSFSFWSLSFEIIKFQPLILINVSHYVMLCCIGNTVGLINFASSLKFSFVFMYDEQSFLLWKSSGSRHGFTYPKDVHSDRYLIPSNSFVICLCIYAFCLRIAIGQPMHTSWCAHTGLIAYIHEKQTKR